MANQNHTTYATVETLWAKWEPIDGEEAYHTSRVCDHPDLAEVAQVGEIGDRRAVAFWVYDTAPTPDGTWTAEPDFDAEPDRIEVG